MIRFVLILQLCFFTAYGSYTGMLINKVKKDGIDSGYTQALFDMSLDGLSNMPVRKI